MHTLNIDIETFSTNDIKTGVHKYFTEGELLLFAYSFDKAPVEVIDIAQGEEIPFDIVDAIFDKRVMKKAWNAAFEIEGLENYFGKEMILSQWQCTMIKSARCGYPLSLGEAAKAIGLPIEKDTAGKALIKLFSVPRKPTKTNPAIRVYPEDQPEKWQLYKEYNKRDVEVEMAADDFFSQYPDTTPFEKKMYILDRQINKRGLELDLPFVRKAIEIDAEHKAILTEEAKEVTGLSNPNSVDQLKNWLEEHTGRVWKGLDKDILRFAIEDGEIPFAERVTHKQGSVKYGQFMAKPANAKKYAKIPKEEWPASIQEIEMDGSLVSFKRSPRVLRMLELRKELGNTSVRKYQAMLASEINSRIYDTIQFNGAGRTGRNAGRLIQPQNLPRIYLEDDELDQARRMVRDNDLWTLETCFGSVSSVLSQLIRTAIVAKEGYTLKVSDLAAIEARVLAWLADEEHVLQVFRTHGKIYEATAAMMFKVPFESIDKKTPKGAEMRQRGKVSALACGYQGGPNAITTMDTDKKIPDDAKPGLVKAWRAAHPKIVRFWYKTQDCAIKAIQNPGEKVPLSKNSYFVTHRDALLFYLPSGRYLMYPKVSLEEGTYGPQIKFWGLDQTTNRWCKQTTYGGKLVENLVQAVARDVLMVGMYNLVRAGYDIVTNVHDEIVAETLLGFGSVEEIEELMCDMPDWAEGLPLGAEGFESNYYKK